MTEKLILTQEQADAVELTKKGNCLNSVLGYILQNQTIPNTRFRPLSALPLEDLMKALVIPYSYVVEPEFKVGDWVKQDVGDGFRIGKITQIYDNRRVLVGFMEYESLFKSYQEAFDIDEIFLATSEEIEDELERQVWNKIGREVGEFKPDDIGITKDNNTHYRNKPGMLKSLYDSGKLKGFYPVESFVKL